MKGAPWSPADDERLRKLVEEGRNSVTIAERLKRTTNAVLTRAHKLKITIIKRVKAKAKSRAGSGSAGLSSWGSRRSGDNGLV
jgi:hypothetical protein